jgi:hypothetical protein
LPAVFGHCRLLPVRLSQRQKQHGKLRARPARGSRRWSERASCKTRASVRSKPPRSRPPRRARQELRRAFEDERRANDDLTRDADRDRQSIEDLKSRWVDCHGFLVLRFHPVHQQQPPYKYTHDQLAWQPPCPAVNGCVMESSVPNPARPALRPGWRVPWRTCVRATRRRPTCGSRWRGCGTITQSFRRSTPRRSARGQARRRSGSLR